MKLLAILLVGLGLFAQDATVYDLTPEETTEGARLYQSMQESEKAFANFKSRMANKYGHDLPINFTPDFKHAVPALTGDVTFQSPLGAWPLCYSSSSAIPAADQYCKSQGDVVVCTANPVK